MTAGQSLNRIYAEQMKHHPQGYALYEPFSTTSLKPGACGYFDDYGTWNPIVQLDDNESLIKRGFEPPDEELEEADDNTNIVWGPKCSSGVKGVKVDIPVGINAEAAGLPFAAKTTFKYSTATDFGAILLTAAPMVKKAYLYQSPFQHWVKKNQKCIRKLREHEVRQHGLWIVTSTYSTTRCSINAWRQASKEVVVGFKARALGEEFGPQGAWYEDETDTGWNHYHASNEDRIVVFVGALRFRFSQMPWVEARLKEMSRATRTIFRSDSELQEPIYVQSEENKEEGYEISCEIVGQTALSHE